MSVLGLVSSGLSCFTVLPRGCSLSSDLPLDLALFSFLDGRNRSRSRFSLTSTKKITRMPTNKPNPISMPKKKNSKRELMLKSNTQ